MTNDEYNRNITEGWLNAVESGDPNKPQTFRDHIAVCWMAAYVSHSGMPKAYSGDEPEDEPEDLLAAMAYNLADAMMRAREA